MGLSLSKIVKAVTDPVGDLLNGLTGVSSSQDATYKQQMASMEAQNAFNEYMWNLQNQYNTPAAQIARMRDAGIDINPTSYALGTGNLSNTASSLSSAGGFQGSGSPAGNPVSMLMGVAQGVQSLKNAKADYQLKQTTNDRTELENQIMSHNLKYGKDHNLPVGSVPGLDQSFGAIVNKGLTDGGKSLYNHLTRPSTKSDTNYFRRASEWIGDKIYQWSH